MSPTPRVIFSPDVRKIDVALKPWKWAGGEVQTPGVAVSDLNGDGLGEVGVGAADAYGPSNGRTLAGEAWLVATHDQDLIRQTGRRCLTLDGGRVVEGLEGQTILEVCRDNGIEIPTLCYEPKLPGFGACRMCVVEVEGSRVLVPSCSRKAEDGEKLSLKLRDLDDLLRESDTLAKDAGRAATGVCGGACRPASARPAAPRNCRN